jgi:RNA polymerase-associated protein RTF1
VGLYELQSDVSAILARKQMMSSKQSAVAVRMEKSRLAQARTLALRRQDFTEVQSINGQIAELNAAYPEMERENTAADVMAKVNERNRKANLEATRKAEQMEAERRKKERKLAAAGARNSPVPSALAALKIGTSRYARSLPSQDHTLNILPRPVTPRPDGTKSESTTMATSVIPDMNDSFEASIADVEIDLGDF